MRHRRRRHQRRPDYVGVEDPAPDFGIRVDHADERADGGRVHHVVDAAERVGDLVDGRPARRLVGDVALDGDCAGPGLLRGRFDALAAPGQERDLLAALRQANRNATPEPARRANHHCPRHDRPLLSGMPFTK